MANPGDQTNPQGESVTVAVNATDPDGDTLSYSATGLPGGVSIDETTGVLSGTLNRVGTFSTSVMVSDGTLSVSATFLWTVLSENPDTQTVTVQPQSGNDDAEEWPDGFVYRSSTDLELTEDFGAAVSQLVGIRFRAVNIPQAATMTEARIIFTVDEASSEPTTLEFWAEANDTAATFLSTAFNVSSRPRTAGSVVWLNVPAWPVIAAEQTSPNLAALIQEVIDRPGWQNGNALGMLIGGSGHRVATSYNFNPSQAARLVIDYLAPTPSNQPPLVTNPNSQATQEGQSVSLPINASDPDNDPLSFSASDLPPGLSIHPTTGVIAGTVALERAGLYNTTVAVSDGQADTTAAFAWLVTTDPPNADIVMRDFSVAGGDDDAEESADGTVVLDNPDLALPDASAAGDELVGLRFQALDIPAGVTILDAYVQFSAAAPTSQPTTLALRGQAISNAAPFTTSVNNLSTRLMTDAFVEWQPEPWQVTGERGEAQRSPDVSAIIQEIINQPGWTANNAAVLLLTGSGSRLALAADGDLPNAPQLHVTYIAEPGVRFAVIGDFGTNGRFEAEVAALIDSRNVDFVATVGDNNYPSGAAATIDDNIGQYYQQYIRPYVGSYGSGAADRNRFWPALGNHDWHPCRNVPQPCTLPHEEYFVLPNNERYYDVVEGPVHLFILDSDANEPDGNSVNSIQVQWLQQRLATSTATHKLVLSHHAPYSSGGAHGSQAFIQWPFKDWGATGVIAAHDHIYERLVVDDLLYIVNGASGQTLYNLSVPLPETQVRYNQDFGALFVTATPSLITYQFVNRHGAIIDTHSLP